MFIGRLRGAAPGVLGPFALGLRVELVKGMEQAAGAPSAGECRGKAPDRFYQEEPQQGATSRGWDLGGLGPGGLDLGGLGSSLPAAPAALAGL